MSLLADKVYDYFAPVIGAGLKLFEDHIDDPRPKKPYVGYQIISNPQVGERSDGEVTAEGTQTGSFNKLLTVQLNFYGEESADAAETFLVRIYDEDTLQLGEQLNLGLLETSQSIDTSIKLAETWERRYSVRIVLSHVVEHVQHVGLIEVVEVEGSYTGGANVTGNDTTLTRIPEDG